jgi:hypothetical protein
MTTIEYWLAEGRLVGRPADAGLLAKDERNYLQRSLCVKLDVDRHGTRVSWCQFAPNWASLFHVMDWIQRLPAPYNLEFFNAGWFSERYPTAGAAASRLEQLIGTSDVHLATRTYISAQDTSLESMPQGLRDAWKLGSAPIERSVICSVDPVLQRSEVMFVGPRSALATVWGLSPVSYPCQTGHSYDRTVSKPYFDVVKQDKPYRDHVLAAMMAPSGEVRWYGYQRVVFPGAANSYGKPTVRIMSETAPVDIRIP